MNISRFTKPARKALKLRTCGAVIVAAGTASRMGGIDKIMAPLGGKPMIWHTVAAFQECAAISEIVIVTREDLMEQMHAVCAEFSKVRAVFVGGDSRQASVSAGLQALSKKVKLAAIQDGARPLVTWQLIDRTVRAANTYHAAAPGVPVKNTIKRVVGGIVQETPDRAQLQAVQTPQVFEIDLLKAALGAAEQDGAAITDDCSAVERLGMSVRMVPGDEENIKVTTPMDLKIAEMILEGRK